MGPRGAAGIALALGVLVTACRTPGDPISPDPVRFSLTGAEPCAVVFGRVAPDASFRFEEVGQLDTPDGPTFVSRGRSVVDRGAPDLEVGGIDVHVSTAGDAVEVVWLLPPTEVAVSTRSLDADALVALVPELVATADTYQLAVALQERIPGADVVDAGMAPGYDVGLRFDESTLSIAGRGAPATRLDALAGILGWERDGDAGWRGRTDGGASARASTATVAVGDAGDVTPVTADAFVDVVERLMGDAQPVVSVGDDGALVLAPGCAPGGPAPVAAASVRDVAIVESDVGDLLDVTFDGLPADDDGSTAVHVTIGGVTLVGSRDRGAVTVRFPSTMSHAESRLVAERLRP